MFVFWRFFCNLSLVFSIFNYFAGHISTYLDFILLNFLNLSRQIDIGRFQALFLSKFISIPTFLLLFLCNIIVRPLKLSHGFLNLLIFYFFLCPSDCIISIHLSSSTLILSYFIFILLRAFSVNFYLYIEFDTSKMSIVFLFIVSIFLLRTFTLTFVSSICLYFKDDFIIAALNASSGNSDI